MYGDGGVARPSNCRSHTAAGAPVLRVLCEEPCPWRSRRGGYDDIHNVERTKVALAASPPTLAKKTQRWGTLDGNGAMQHGPPAEDSGCVVGNPYS
jgi:hypothetical protein